jgi:hypothetical protein
MQNYFFSFFLLGFWLDCQIAKMLLITKQVLNEDCKLRQKNTLKKSVFNWLIQFVFDIVFTIQVFIKIINFNGFGFGLFAVAFPHLKFLPASSSSLFQNFFSTRPNSF